MDHNSDNYGTANYGDVADAALTTDMTSDYRLIKAPGGNSSTFLQNITVWIIFAVCVILGPLNFVLYKMLYDAYGNEGAFFASQGVNVLYIVFGGSALSWTSYRGEISDETRRTPHIKFIIMGMLDCLAGFFCAMGAANTSGAAQQLLNQSLIPCTMLFSWIFLQFNPTRLEILGSIVILIGSFIVISPALISNDSALHPVSMMIYFTANIPFAASYTYKEHSFKALSINVIYLAQWVSIYQMIIGFAMAPLQIIPGMGSATGMTVTEIFNNFNYGIDCFLEIPHKCKHQHSFALLIAYTLVNAIFNTLGLYLCKHGSATLNAISYAIILPLTTLVFSASFLGHYQEAFRSETLLGLACVLIGFFLWKSKAVFSQSPTEATTSVHNDEGSGIYQADERSVLLDIDI